MNSIDALVDALERQGDTAAAKQLETSLDELESLDEAERSKRYRALLEGWANQSKRLIVLLVDNLDLVLDRLSDWLWELREALSLDNRLVMIGASSRFVEETIDYQSPFYDFFRVHELGPLSEDEARAVVLSLARRANTPNVSKVLERDPGRFKALFVLTGGTPRTLALLHTVLAFDQNDSIERDLDGLLDQLTPYYKARFDDLPAQSQVVVDKVALHWHPITAAECQAATRLDVNVVSAQLSRLVKAGVLSKVTVPGPGKLGFQLSERFFNVWYLMRASRRLRRRLSWLVEFLRMFYGEDELRKRAEELIRAAPADSLTDPAKFLAFATAISDEALRRRLEFQAICLLADKGTIALREMMDLEGEDVHLVPVIDRVRALRDIRAQVASANIQWPLGLSSNDVAETIVRSPLLPMTLKQQASRQVAGASAAMLNDLCKFVTIVQKNTIGAPERLLAAIATGEVPSLSDVGNLEEVRQIANLMGSCSQATALIMALTEHAQTPLREHVLQQLIDSEDSGVDAIIRAACVLVEHHKWNRARQLILLIARHASAKLSISEFVNFFGHCIAAGLAREAFALFSETGLMERWAPLYEALRAVADDDVSLLDKLAPEIRGTARAIYNHLRERDSRQVDEAPITASSSTPPGRQPARKRTGPKRPISKRDKRTVQRRPRAKPA